MTDFNFKNTTVNSWDSSTTEDWKTTFNNPVVTKWYEESYNLILLNYVNEDYSLMEVIKNYINEDYNITINTLNLFIEPYVDLIRSTFNLIYADVSVPLKEFNEYYNDMFLPVNTLNLRYGNTVPMYMSYDEDYEINQGLLVFFNEDYVLTQEVVQQTVNQDYDIETVEKVSTSMFLEYSILEGTTQVINPSALFVVDGEYIDFLNMDISLDSSSYVITCNISLSSAEDYALCTYLKEVSCIIEGETFNFFIETRKRTVSNKQATYTLQLLSITAKLDAPYAAVLVESFSEGITAQTLITQMAATASISIDYQLMDWFIPGYSISINDETPYAVIKRVVNAIGGIVQTKPDGTLLLISEYPDPLPNWDIVTSVQDFTAEDYLTMQEDTTINKGYNAFLISNQASSTNNIFLQEEAVDSITKIIKGFRIPFADGAFELDTSGGPGISIEKTVLPVEEAVPKVNSDGDPIDEEWEIIEFVEYKGVTSNPIYDIIDYEWLEDDLGAFTTSEDGTLTITNQGVVDGESLLKLKYTTKYWEWTVIGPDATKVQLFVPEVA